MGGRTKKSQSRHDNEVKRITREFKKKGYDVKADIPGYSRPDTISGYRPDIVATKGNQTKIVEVETTESISSARDIKQSKAFRNAATRSKSTTFRRKVVDTKKK